MLDMDKTKYIPSYKQTHELILPRGEHGIILVREDT